MAFGQILLRRIQLNYLYTPGIRHLYATPLTMEKALEKLEKNPYYDKYADRIAQLQKTSPEEFMSRIEHTKVNPNKQIASIDTRQFSSALNPKASLKEPVDIAAKKLSDIFKIELVEEKDGSEIQRIWEEYHINKEVISATIPLSMYTEIQTKMKEFSTFIFPLPRSQGYEFIMCQCQGHAAHFTPLLAFQVHKENAPEALTMVHYTELQHKGLVLMRGDYDKNVLNAKEAQCLANQFQMYYNGKDRLKLELLEKFTKHPEDFKHMELVSQLENIGLV